jgi:radical SAM superfamily enzyme YgiQ (UPF0313 family)
MKILLISPGKAGDIDNIIIREIPYLFAKAFFFFLSLASVAALTPREHDVIIHDEYMRGPVDNLIINEKYDIIGITVISNQLNRCLKLAELCRKHNPKALLVAGGIGIETIISKNNDIYDVVFHGEAEETWPRFLEDFKKGNYQKIYKNISKPDMTKTPIPRWDLISEDITSYNAVSVQTTRGCPFDCSFCDVIYTYGRKPRSKNIDQVIEEVKNLYALNVRAVFIADDNFTGNKEYAKELLRKLIELNNSFKLPLSFLTQLDINIARDDELLKLLADCNFFALMIGIESVNEDSLRDMNKKQNLNISISEAIKKIQSYGLVVLAHMIVGADSDDSSVFKKTEEFIMDAGIVFHYCHPLSAPPGTKMWYDLKRQGRIIASEHIQTDDKLDIITNIIPKQLTRTELLDGLANYWDEVFDIDKFTMRAISFVKGIKYKAKVKSRGILTLWDYRKMMALVFKFFIFQVDKQHRKAFFKIMRSAGPRLTYLMPKIIYVYTFYMLDMKRSKHDAEIAREHSKWEKENPEMLVIEPSEIPISEKIREYSSIIFAAAYDHVRQKVDKKELLYNSVVCAMQDFNDRFGPTFDTFDEFHKEQVINTCDRVLNQITEFNHDDSVNLPLTAPSGFTREILDALDKAVRYKDIY